VGKELLKGLKNGLDEDRLGHVMDQRACDREAVGTNVKVDPCSRPCTWIVADRTDLLSNFLCTISWPHTRDDWLLFSIT
jgi:hypothetical protein